VRQAIARLGIERFRTRALSRVYRVDVEAARTPGGRAVFALSLPDTR
jgi:hypothetical protein